MRIAFLIGFFGVMAFAAEPAPVVVELYTSEGCSSCPSAENLLQKMSASDQYLIVVTWHVTYWDHLGWKDPWGIPEAEVRQHAIAKLTSGQMFTPQAIIQGRMSRVGSDHSGLEAAIQDARTRGPALASLPRVTAQNGDCQISFETFPQSAPITVMVVQDHLTKSVLAGENSGSTLRHEGVVRWWKRVAPTASITVKLPANSTVENLQIVAFSHTGQGTICAAGRVPWPITSP